MSSRAAAGWAGGIGAAGLVLAAAAHAQPVPEHAQPTIAHGQAVLQGLDKVTARVSPVMAPIGEPVRFGSLEITARTCLETPPTEPPESAAFLEIRELPPDEPPADLFAGWMFASSPALSALEHPVYDIWVVDCGEPLEPLDGDAASAPAQEG